MSRSTTLSLKPLLSVAAAVGTYSALIRPRLLRWGATDEETGRVLPGDELVPYADSQMTFATTLPAPPEEVWPWLQQMGCDRAGWYSWDRLDNAGHPSADRIVPEWQDLRAGHHLDSTPDGDTWFTAAVVDPPSTLVLKADLELPSGRSFDPAVWPLPHAYTGGVWGFHLEPSGDDATRVVVRTRFRSKPRALLAVVGFLYDEPAHFVMQTRQFHNLRSRVRRERSRQEARPAAA
jgi:proline iminopeptidase